MATGESLMMLNIFWILAKMCKVWDFLIKTCTNDITRFKITKTNWKFHELFLFWVVEEFWKGKGRGNSNAIKCSFDVWRYLTKKAGAQRKDFWGVTKPMGWRKNSESHSMDYVRHGKIQWQWTVKKTKEWPCISPCLTYIICPLHPVEIGLTDGTTGLSTTIFQPITTKRCNLNCRCVLRQWYGRRKFWKSEGASNTVVGIICPPGWDRVNCLAKKLWVADFSCWFRGIGRLFEE